MDHANESPVDVKSFAQNASELLLVVNVTVHLKLPDGRLILDIIFVNFNIMKCIVYVILFAAFIIFIIFNKVIKKKV